MRLRWVTGIVCLLYLSVSTVFAAMHDHESDLLRPDPDCIACLWHHEGQFDLPVVCPFVPQPLRIALREEPPHSFFREVSIRIHPSRGPPVIPL